MCEPASYRRLTIQDGLPHPAPPLQDGAAANVRAKAIKAIGAAIDRDVAVLGLPDVQAAVREALHDDSVSVREAAVDLFGRCAGGAGWKCRGVDVNGCGRLGLSCTPHNNTEGPPRWVCWGKTTLTDAMDPHI